MRTLSSALQTVLASGGPFVKADLVTITLANGTVLNWTTGETSLTVGGTTYVKGPPLTRGKASWKTGLAVDKIVLTIDDDDSSTINGVALVEAGWQNLYDLAQVSIQRFISDSWTNTAVGAVPWFIGEVGQVTLEGKKITLDIESPLAQFRSTFPRTYVMPSCSNTFCDAVCGLLESNFTHAGSVGAGATASSFPLTLSGGNLADGTFQAGKITFTSGANAGQIRTVRSYVGGVITLVFPLYQVPAAGDTVNALEGCLKTQAACTAHGNLPHFRGFPYVPDPSTQWSGAGSGAPESTNPGGGRGGRIISRIGPRGIRGRINQF